MGKADVDVEVGDEVGNCIDTGVEMCGWESKQERLVYQRL